MATSVKAVLRKKKNKANKYPLAIRITKNRKSSYIYLGVYLDLKQWDDVNQRVRKSHPNSTRLNNLIKKEQAKVSDTVIATEVEKTNTSSRSIKTKTVNQRKSGSFFRMAKEYIGNLKKSGSYNRVSAEKPRIKRFEEFLDGSDIAFEDITVPLLQRYQAYLRNTRSIKERTVVNHLVVIRTIFNQAIKGGLADQKHYPFGKGGIKIKFPDSSKVGLTMDEVKRLEEVELSDFPSQDHARNVWLLSFYFAGMRASDVLRLRWSDIRDGRLYYAMGKNAKFGSLKISTKAKCILEQYKERTHAHDLVFPELEGVPDMKDTYEVQKKVQYAVSKFRKLLKRIAPKAGIDKKLSMHIARHTFGNISGDKIPIQMLQKLYRHSNVTTTINYQASFMHRETDSALEAVIGE